MSDITIFILWPIPVWIRPVPTPDPPNPAKPFPFLAGAQLHVSQSLGKTLHCPSPVGGFNPQL